MNETSPITMAKTDKAPPSSTNQQLVPIVAGVVGGVIALLIGIILVYRCKSRASRRIDIEGKNGDQRGPKTAKDPEKGDTERDPRLGFPRKAASQVSLLKDGKGPERHVESVRDQPGPPPPDGRSSSRSKDHLPDRMSVKGGRNHSSPEERGFVPHEMVLVRALTDKNQSCPHPVLQRPTNGTRNGGIPSDHVVNPKGQTPLPLRSDSLPIVRSPRSDSLPGFDGPRSVVRTGPALPRPAAPVVASFPNTGELESNKVVRPSRNHSLPLDRPPPRSTFLAGQGISRSRRALNPGRIDVDLSISTPANQALVVVIPKIVLVAPDPARWSMGSMRGGSEGADGEMSREDSTRLSSYWSPRVITSSESLLQVPGGRPATSVVEEDHGNGQGNGIAEDEGTESQDIPISSHTTSVGKYDHSDGQQNGMAVDGEFSNFPRVLRSVRSSNTLPWDHALTGTESEGLPISSPTGDAHHDGLDPVMMSPPIPPAPPLPPDRSEPFPTKVSHPPIFVLTGDDDDEEDEKEEESGSLLPYLEAETATAKASQGSTGKASSQLIGAQRATYRPRAFHLPRRLGSIEDRVDNRVAVAVDGVAGRGTEGVGVQASMVEVDLGGGSVAASKVGGEKDRKVGVGSGVGITKASEGPGPEKTDKRRRGSLWITTHDTVFSGEHAVPPVPKLPVAGDPKATATVDATPMAERKDGKDSIGGLSRASKVSGLHRNSRRGSVWVGNVTNDVPVPVPNALPVAEGQTAVVDANPMVGEKVRKDPIGGLSHAPGKLGPDKRRRGSLWIATDRTRFSSEHPMPVPPVPGYHKATVDASPMVEEKFRKDSTGGIGRASDKSGLDRRNLRGSVWIRHGEIDLPVPLPIPIAIPLAYDHKTVAEADHGAVVGADHKAEGKSFKLHSGGVSYQSSGQPGPDRRSRRGAVWMTNRKKTMSSNSNAMATGDNKTTTTEESTMDDLLSSLDQYIGDLSEDGGFGGNE